ncbi:uncharacterized protein MELLADRAFT_111260 [Melampsora larici-populina 98AG31]|uniref:CxC1-like cysteine cluster associated with KDZ transposases domain-containing protein n=1 Tax=Melampsora larici-populina (strain 98AG31 / pathotype 3-4-7) TaxID=747676 RepID=F4S2W1_MELLP|nr:uncharacterized protein MELLADRAFT_111260 [Melampsora larici-populina 98AG31]EGG01012.1 hypothetical protein MELLADRAFT_111260 [Melampsora larici-populina 98AG31]
MPGRRIIPGLNKCGKDPKPLTPLQQQHLRLQRKDKAHAAASNRRLLAQLNQQNDARPPDEDVPAPEEENHIAYPPDLAEDDAAEDDVNNPDFDMNQFMPRHDLADALEEDPDDPVMIELKRQLRLDDRLKHEERWAWQYAIMLPTFLRNRLETSNWGLEARWDEDFRPPCNCACKTERNVDMVDLLSKKFVH